MEKSTAIDLKYVTTDDLIDELGIRHNEMIIIRENLRNPEWLNIWAKTNSENPKTAFEYIKAINLMNAAERQMLKDLDDCLESEGGSGDSQDAREG